MIRIILIAISLCAIGSACSSKSTQIQIPRPPSDLNGDALLSQIQPEKEFATVYETPTMEARLTLEPHLLPLLESIKSGNLDVSDTVRDALKKAGFRFHVVDANGEQFAIFTEDSRWTGRGAYIFRVGPAEEMVIQAPHSYHDIDSGKVAFGLFSQTRSRALFLNTAHRYAKKNAKARGPNPADLSHRSDTFFFIFTSTYASLGRSTFVQIHGFERDGNTHDIIISDTTRDPTELTTNFAQRLSSGADYKIGIYGKDTKILGATSNPVGRWLKRHDIGDFLHVELSPEVRKAWSQNPTPLAKALATP